MVWIDLRIKGKKLAVVNIYREFQLWLEKGRSQEKINSIKIAEQFKRFSDFIDLWEKSIKNYDELWVLGDFNLDFDKIRKETNSPQRKFLSLLENRILNKGFSQLFKEPTYTKDTGTVRSCLDHIYTNAKHYKSVLVAKCSNSDHDMISVIRPCQAKFLRTQFRWIRNFQNFEKDDFTYILNTLNLDDICWIEDPNEQVQALTAALNLAADWTCPLSVVQNRAYHTKWMSIELKQLIGERDCAYRKYTALFNREPGSNRTIQAFNLYKSLRNKVNKELPKAKRNYFSHLIDVAKVKDPKACWRNLDSLSGRNSTYNEPIYLEDDQGEIIEDPKKIAERFSEFFDAKIDKIKASLPKAKNNEKINLSHLESEFGEVTQREILDHIDSLSNSAAFGIDTISNQLLKHAKYLISRVLVSICNNCLKKSIFPECWKVGKINALHKKGSKTDVSNYRPVTILPSLSKLLEKVIFKRLYSHFEHFKLFDPRQYGFRKNHSTTLAIIDYITSVLKAKENPETKRINAIFLDLSSAFDLVDYDILLKKLRTYGFGEKVINLMESYLVGREVFTEVETELSQKRKVKYGVPQGSILGPLLYVIFNTNITEIEDKVNGEVIKSIKIMYADDTSCIVMARDDEQLETNSNIVMENLVNYYEGAGLKLNTNKTEIVSHCSKIIPSSEIVDPKFKKVQKSVQNARLLGVQIDTDFSFETHIDNIIRDVKYKLRIFKKVQKTVNQRNRVIYGSSVLLSSFTYCLSVYSAAGSTLMTKVRNLYDKCIKAIYNADKRSTVTVEFMRKTLKILDFDDLIAFYDINIFNKIIKTGEPIHIAKYIETSERTVTRGDVIGNCRIKYIPKSEKLKNNFLTRACKSYNKTPGILRDIDGKEFNVQLKNYLLGLPITVPGNIINFDEMR